MLQTRLNMYQIHSLLNKYVKAHVDMGNMLYESS